MRLLLMCIHTRGFILVSFFFFFKQKTAYEVRISDWSSDVCSSDLLPPIRRQRDEVVSWVREGRTNVSKGRKINGFEWPILCAASYLRGVADSRVERRRCRPRRQAQKYRRQRRSN